MRQATPDTIARGRSYFYSGHASVIAASRFRAVVMVRGDGIEPHSVTVSWSAAGASAVCNCPLSESDPRLICKHKVAAALATEHYFRLHPRISWQSVLDDALQISAKPPARPTRHALLFSLQQRYSNWSIYVYSLGAAHFERDGAVDPATITQTIQRDQLSHKAKQLRTAIDRSRIVNATDSLIIAADLCWAYQQAWSYTWNTPQTVHRLIRFLKECPFFLGTEDNPLKTPLALDDNPALLQVELIRSSAGLKLVPIVTTSTGDRIELTPLKSKFVSTNPAWILHEDRLIEMEGSIATVEPLLRADDVTIPDSEVSEFMARYLPALAGKVPIAGEGLHWSDLDSPPVPRVYLKQSEFGDPVAEMRFAYGDQGIVLGPNTGRHETEVVHVAKDQTFVRVKRHIEAEMQAEQVLVTNGLRKDHRTDEYTLRSTTNVLNFLIHQIPRIIEAGFEVFGEESLAGAKINRSTPRLSMQVSSGIDWFDVKLGVAFGDATASIKSIKQAIKKRERYIKLSDGSIGALPDEWVKKYSYLFSLDAEKHEGDGELRLQRHHAILLGDLLGQADDSEADSEFMDVLDRLSRFRAIEPRAVPAELKDVLRPYQAHGFDWLHFLREYGAGGCIADDMGLGKTIQVLAFLQSLALDTAKPRRASLIVVPRSLIFNWQREAARFTPSLKVLAHADQQRAKTAAQFNRHDIVLTTYGILVRDIEMLKAHTFRCAILDESQAIKNPAALSAKASRLIKAEQRITLTGTPVENSTQDLWSQFAFLNPGLLGTLEQFRTQFGAAIDRSQDETSAAMLRRLVYPFILRRTKEQVAPELPPRTERIVYSEMEPDQRKIYDETKAHYQHLLMGLIDRDGMTAARMKVLEGLLRLRQICNHPRLARHDYDGQSAKFEGLIQTLLTLQSEGHKALVFSQFVQMLKLVESELARLAIPYTMLTGQTRDRQDKVDQFQNNPEIPFFLISLKAGGIGLNLTAADYVIHIDPWWNPAVEMQATDRTHRIGQDKPVFIYKLIARDTVEDKILQLQERKRAVVQQVIAGDSGFFKSLTRDDIAALFG
jgi:non-specific serine/threonine protein kinase